MQKRSLEQLIDTQDPAWPVVQDWLRSGENDYVVLGTEREQGERTLLDLQVTTRSPMGALTLETGGILIDHGWLRILGAGCGRMKGSLSNWNGLGDEPLSIRPLQGALVVANDAAGGFFAINGGGFVGVVKNLFYFAADRLEWEDLGIGYSDFLSWATTERLALFYEALRWPGWREEIAGLSLDQCIDFFPPLFTREGSPAGSRRQAVPLSERWGLYVNG